MSVAVSSYADHEQSVFYLSLCSFCVLYSWQTLPFSSQSWCMLKNTDLSEHIIRKVNLLPKIKTQKLFLNYFWSLPGCSLCSMDNLDLILLFFPWWMNMSGVFVIGIRDTDLVKIYKQKRHFNIFAELGWLLQFYKNWCMEFWIMKGWCI